MNKQNKSTLVTVLIGWNVYIVIERTWQYSTKEDV